MNRPTRDLLITATETNNHHGVGILLQRFFPNSADFVCLRTTSLYRGEEPFGSEHHELCSRFLTFAELKQHLGQILELYRIRRILCVPYYREEFVHALLAKEMTGAPLCTFLMDDQNVFTSKVADRHVAALLAASNLRLAISPEMAAAYEKKFGFPLHVLPPVVEPALQVPCYWRPQAGEPLRAAMIGNVWTASRLRQLLKVLPEIGIELDWYGKGPEASWLEGTPEEWEASNLRVMGFLPEEELTATLASYPFIVLPSGTLDEADDNPSFTRLSLPSRLLFLHARIDVPVLVLGSPAGAAGRLVTKCGTGLCAGFDATELRAQIAELTASKTHAAFRQAVRRFAPRVVLADGGNWIWRALARGVPEPAAFHQLFPADYLAGAEAFITGAPSEPVVAQPALPSGRPLVPADLPALAFGRCDHLETFRDSVELGPPAEVDLTAFSAAAAAFVLRHTLRPGDNFLFIGDHLPTQLAGIAGATGARGWGFADIGAWQQAGFAGDPALLVDLQSGQPHPAQFPQFAAIVSTGWCGQLGNDPHVLEGVALYLDACTAPGGWNFHGFSAILHPTYFWTGPAHAYLRDRFCEGGTWPGLDELLAADDLFVMSERAYDRFWRSTVRRPYAEIGKPLALGLGWRKRASGRG